MPVHKNFMIHTWREMCWPLLCFWGDPESLFVSTLSVSLLVYMPFSFSCNLLAYLPHSRPAKQQRGVMDLDNCVLSGPFLSGTMTCTIQHVARRSAPTKQMLHYRHSAILRQSSIMNNKSSNPHKKNTWYLIDLKNKKYEVNRIQFTVYFIYLVIHKFQYKYNHKT